MITDAGFIAFGLMVGVLHFSLLRWNTTLYARPGWFGTGAALQVGRLGTLGGLLAVVALHGALPLLFTALGVLIARPVVMRWMAPLP
ncbi:MAG: ATP synthase subunit I [Rhodopila sp.]|nr:ATP synthase subunit I [Rhodopila sp.]